MSWPAMGAVPATSLLEARLQLHHAVQVAAAAGMSFLEPRPDDSHPNLGFDVDGCALVGRPLPATGMSVGLRLPTATLISLDSVGDVKSEFPIRGSTLDQAYQWLSQVTEAEGAVGDGRIVRSSYEVPHHPVADGASFSIENDGALAELAAFYSAAAHGITRLSTELDGATDVRCWPHHFDLATLIVVLADADGSVKKSIGVGFSPGDPVFSQPYFYVSPWPYPSASSLLPLGGPARWHTDGYTAAILLGEAFASAGADVQEELLETFIRESVDASFKLLNVKD